MNSLCFSLLISPKDQALLVADQFVVTFDGHLYELPGSCPLLLARDVGRDPTFTLLLGTDTQNLLLIQMNNHTISVQRNGQVCVTLDE